MKANAFFNRIEILLYSTLISAMSGINKLRTRLQPSAALPAQPLPDIEAQPPQVDFIPKVSVLTLGWNAMREALLPLLLWVILGFAAGFLIGMINPR